MLILTSVSVVEGVLPDAPAAGVAEKVAEGAGLLPDVPAAGVAEEVAEGAGVLPDVSAAVSINFLPNARPAACPRSS